MEKKSKKTAGAKTVEPKKKKKVLKKIKQSLEKLRKKRDKQNSKLNNLIHSGAAVEKVKEIKERLTKIEKKTKKKLKKLKASNAVSKKPARKPTTKVPSTTSTISKEKTQPKLAKGVKIKQPTEKLDKVRSGKLSADLPFKEAIVALKRFTDEKKIENFIATEKRSTVMNAAKARIKAVRKAIARAKKIKK